MREMNADHELVERAAGGDRDAFEALVRAYEKRVYNMTLRMTGSNEDAYDLSQEIFLRVWRALPMFKGEASFSTWLHTLASNACIDHARRERRRNDISLTGEGDDGAAVETELPDLRYSPESALEKKQIREAVDQALSELSFEHRQAVVLRDVQGLSYAEMAEILSLSEGTVKSRLSRAREALRKILTARGNFFAKEPSNRAKEG